MPHNPFHESDRKITGDIYTTPAIWENLRTLTDDFGSRFGGTEGERLAAEYLRDRLIAYGLQNVALEPVEYLGWRRRPAVLEILAPVEKSLPCISLPHSPAATVETTLVDLGDAAPAWFERRSDEIDGRIVLVNSVVSPPGTSRWIHRSEKLGRAIMAGGVGFIFANHYPGYGPPTGGIGFRNRPALIPGIGLSYEDGAYLSRLARQGEVRLRLITSDETEPMVSWNVVGELPGRTEALVILGCHYDGHDIAQGAEDPVSGTAAVLEAARTLAAYGGTPECTLRFVFWGIEEIGLIGSRAYVAAHADELDRVRFYLNLDSAGAVKEKGIVLNEWPDLQPVFEGWSREMSHPFLVGQSINAHSDHYPFLMEGVPTGGMESVKKDLSGRGYGHTAYDTLDKVSLAGVREAAALAARLALRIANADDWPAERRPKEEIDALFKGPQYAEEQAYRDAIAAYYEKNG
jgi:Iap family predicted aminopeptidase